MWSPSTGAQKKIKSSSFSKTVILIQNSLSTVTEFLMDTLHRSDSVIGMIFICTQKTCDLGSPPQTFNEKTGLALIRIFSGYFMTMAVRQWSAHIIKTKTK